MVVVRCRTTFGKHTISPPEGGASFGPPLSTLFRRTRACGTDADGQRRPSVIQLNAHSVAPALDSQVPGGDHAGSIVALLYLPIVVMGLLLALDAGARAGVPAAMRLRSAFIDSSSSVRMAAFGMSISATIHLALAPSHWTEDHVRAVLFALDGIALATVAISSLLLRTSVWRAAAVALLSADVFAYFAYVVAGVEQFDTVGIATKLVELVVIGLVLVGSTHHVGSCGSWLRELVSHKANGGLFR